MNESTSEFLQTLQDRGCIQEFSVTTTKNSNNELEVDIILKPINAVDFIIMPMTITRESIVAETRKLDIKWTPELVQDLQNHNLDIEDEITRALSDEIVKEIDDLIIEQITRAAEGLDHRKPVIDLGAEVLKPRKQTVGGSILPSGPSIPTQLPFTLSGPIHV